MYAPECGPPRKPWIRFKRCNPAHFLRLGWMFGFIVVVTTLHTWQSNNWLQRAIIEPPNGAATAATAAAAVVAAGAVDQRSGSAAAAAVVEAPPRESNARGGGGAVALPRAPPRPQPDVFTSQSLDSTSKFLHYQDERIAAVTAVIVMESGPAAAAETAHFLHARCPFIHELVLWNNANQTMNHHMLPYDLAIRYVKAPRDYGSYARALACMLARHEICYFQGESTRPIYVDSLYATFLRMVVVVGNESRSPAEAPPSQEVVVAITQAMGGNSQDTPASYIDWAEGAIAHKDVVKRHLRTLDRIGGGGGQGLMEAKAATSDILMSCGLRRRPVVFSMHAHTLDSRSSRSTSHHHRNVPTSRDVSEAATRMRSKYAPLASIKPSDEKTNTFKAPCYNGRCVLVTNVLRSKHDEASLPTSTDEPSDFATPSSLRNLANAIAKDRIDAAIASMGQVHTAVNTDDQGLDATQAFYAAVDGDYSTAWTATMQIRDENVSDNSSHPRYIGLELLRPTIVTGLRLVLAAGEHTSRPPQNQHVMLRLEYSTQKDGIMRYSPAVSCVSEWTWWTPTTAAIDIKKRNDRPRVPLMTLTFACPAVTILGARLVFHGLDLLKSMSVAEIELTRLALAQHVDHFVGPATTPTTTAITTTAAPHQSLRIAYILPAESISSLPGMTLALLEEACELAASSISSISVRMNHVALLVAGQLPILNRKSTLDNLSAAFAAASGSSCDLATRVEMISAKKADELADNDDRLLQQPANRAWDVIFVSSLLESGDRAWHAINSHMHSSTVLVARTDDGRQYATPLGAAADAVTVAGKQAWLSALQQSDMTNTDIRITYPLRTLPHAVANNHTRPRVLTPTNPRLEELVVLTTSTTTATDVHLFERHALPILADHGVFIRRENTSQLVERAVAAQLAGDDGSGGGQMTTALADLDTIMRQPRWRSVRELARYVAIYPARALWILDSTANAGYYASVASTEGARFVVSPAGMPHYANRMLAWNATCDWSEDGFVAKTRELVRGTFYWSSSVRDRDYLKADASDILLDEWPVKRESDPLAHTLSEVERHIASLRATKIYNNRFKSQGGGGG